MRTGKKAIGLLLALVLAMLAALGLSGCGGGSQAPAASITDNTVVGSRVFVDPSNVVFFGYHNLLGTAIIEDGDVREFVIEAGMTGDIYAVAVTDGYLYTLASDGIFKYDLGMFSGESSAGPVVLAQQNMSQFHGFEIHQGKLYFTNGVELYYVPTDGGAVSRIALDTTDFEVTDKGVYYVTQAGKLHLLSLDFKDDQELADLAYGCEIAIGRSSIYYVDGSELKAFSLADNSVNTVATEHAPGKDKVPWINGETLLYKDSDNNVYLLTQDGEKFSGTEYLVPMDKVNGYVYDDYLLGVNLSYSNMVVWSMAGVNSKTYNLDDELRSQLDAAGISFSGSGSGSSSGSGSGSGGSDSSSSGSDGQSGSAGSGTDTSSGAYDIMAGASEYSDGGITYLYFNDFLLVMPDADDWAYDVSENRDAVTIYLIAAREAGYGGNLVTIRAYDLDDNSYTQVPHYSVAGVGRNVSKRFVAIFPTDVRWDPDDSAQGERYKELETYLLKIGEGAVHSPLVTADSA